MCARSCDRRSRYGVIEAPDPGEAILVAAQSAIEIDMVLTVMPGMNVRELAESLVTVRPEMKVLLMSSYTDDEVVRHGVSGAARRRSSRSPSSPTSSSRRCTPCCKAPAASRIAPRVASLGGRSERWQSGRMRRSRKPLRVVRRVEGSNPSLSA